MSPKTCPIARPVRPWYRAAMSIDSAPDHEEHHALVRSVARMPHEGAALAQLAALGLSIVHVTWEDSARYHGSAVGPNISDMTLQVQSRTRAGRHLTCMPVIRYPNFSDRSGDLPIDAVRLQVGNERGEPLRTLDLRSYLGEFRAHLTRPERWPGAGRSLLAPRDTHVLLSAQACFLPVPRRGIASFTPAIFNYPSTPGRPAVLAILSTREGTSATVIDNQRDPALRGFGQRLYYNAAGQRAPFTGQRASEVRVGPATRGDPSSASAVLLIQVPLLQTPAPRAATMDSMELERGTSDVESAVIGHGELEGPFTEIPDLPIERDPRYPIRVTVQYYKATSSGALDDEDILDIGAQLERAYADASAVGSLVTGGDAGRVTAWDDEGAGKREPPRWWGGFWRR